VITQFTKKELQQNYDLIEKSSDNELFAYRGKKNGLFRIIDVESGCCLLSEGGCILTKNINHALILAKKYFNKS
tara:strand:- start:1764 stop:1985 length:222 start_codon:yes stop_codon:yes gene_type:complete